LVLDYGIFNRKFRYLSGGVMDVAQVIELGRESLWVAVLVAAPLLGVALAVGLLIGIFQAATSIQEMTLSFIPKLGVMVLALMAFGSWQISIMVDFIRRIFERIPMLFM
jgi:flagellar biosynthetic protein FliQ